MGTVALTLSTRERFTGGPLKPEISIISSSESSWMTICLCVEVKVEAEGCGERESSLRLSRRDADASAAELLCDGRTGAVEGGGLAFAFDGVVAAADAAVVR